MTQDSDRDADLDAKQTPLRGTVIRKSAVKSFESWNAGGGEYFVLDVGDAAVKERTADEGVILRPTESVTEHDLAGYVDRQVQVSGSYVPGKPYVPVEVGESYPMGTDGQPALRGSGFAVSAIDDVVEE